jgi:hypothetical protein
MIYDSNKKTVALRIFLCPSLTRWPMDADYVCPVAKCHTKFGRNYSLKTHLLTIHADLDPMRCFPAHFQRLRTRTDMKIFKCPHPGCAKAYSMKNNCMSHYRHAHVVGYGPKKTVRRAARGERLAAMAKGSIVAIVAQVVVFDS